MLRYPGQAGKWGALGKIKGSGGGGGGRREVFEIMAGKKGVKIKGRLGEKRDDPGKKE